MNKLTEKIIHGLDLFTISEIPKGVASLSVAILWGYLECKSVKSYKRYDITPSSLINRANKIIGW